MIQILKASAGSGKTFNLAKEYIELLMRSGDPYAYRHILAVTFTKVSGKVPEKLRNGCPGWRKNSSATY